jgi:uncharacterized membrane protein YtjA (UPF0391 family)
MRGPSSFTAVQRTQRRGSAVWRSVTQPVARMEASMLNWAIAFFIIAIVAALFGFTGIAAGAAEIAKILFFVFLVLFLVSLVVGLLRR